MADESQRLVGRTVRYALAASDHFAGQPRPAVVTAARDAAGGPVLALVVFKAAFEDDGESPGACFLARDVSHDPAGSPGTWRRLDG